MSNYSSYSTYAPATEDRAPQQPAVRIYQHAGATSITVKDGEATTEHKRSDGYDIGNMGADTYGADDWRSTARSKGSPTTTITRDCVVTIGGIQGRVSDFVSA